MKRNSGGGEQRDPRKHPKSTPNMGIRLLLPAPEGGDSCWELWAPAAPPFQDDTTPNSEGACPGPLPSIGGGFPVVSSWIGGAGRPGSITGRTPKSPIQATASRGVSLHTHINNICILRMGRGEGGGAGHSLSPDPLPPQRPLWPRIDHASGYELMHGASAARGTRVGTREGRNGLRGVSPVARAALRGSARPARPSPHPLPLATHSGWHSLPPQGQWRGSGASWSDPISGLAWLMRAPASATAALPAHAEHPSSTRMKSLHGNQAIRPT